MYHAFPSWLNVHSRLFYSDGTAFSRFSSIKITVDHFGVVLNGEFKSTDGQVCYWIVCVIVCLCDSVCVDICLFVYLLRFFSLMH
jgi:hypothetical protein